MKWLARMMAGGCLTLLIALPASSLNGPGGWAVEAVPLLLSQEPVTGLVVSARTGQPLAGAQVVIEGTAQGTVTNASGRFLFTDVEGETVTLRVVLIGYRDHTETVAAGSSIRIDLEETAIDLDAIVVTGTAGGSQTRAIGTTIAQVNMAEAMQVGQSGTIQELLSSNVSGLNMASGPGNVGTGGAIKIRGIGSVSLGSGPLVYVDGVRIDNNSNARIGSDQGNSTMRGGAVSRLNDLNPEEIESVEVIKGPRRRDALRHRGFGRRHPDHHETRLRGRTAVGGYGASGSLLPGPMPSTAGPRYTTRGPPHAPTVNCCRAASENSRFSSPSRRSDTGSRSTTATIRRTGSPRGAERTSSGTMCRHRWTGTRGSSTGTTGTGIPRGPTWN